MNRLRKVLDMEESKQYGWLWKHQDEFGFDLKWIDLVEAGMKTIQANQEGENNGRTQNN